MGAMLSSRQRRSAGFTLLELMVTVAVLAVVIAAAAPALSAFVTTNRVAARANDLVGSFNYARSEAVTRGQPVTTCVANAARDGCADSSDWSGGWIVFTDASGVAGTLDDTDLILRVVPPLPAGGSLTTSATRAVRYLPTGFLAAAAGPFTLHFSDCSEGHARRIALTPQGRPQLSPSAC